VPDTAKRAAGALDSVGNRHVRDLDTVLSQHVHHMQALDRDVRMSPEMYKAMTEGAPAPDSEDLSAAAIPPQGREALAASAATVLERFSDLSLHALGELSSAAVAQLLTLEREFAGTGAGGESASAVLEETMILRSDAVRHVAQAAVKGLRLLSAAFTRGAETVVEDWKNRCASPLQDGPPPELEALSASAASFKEGFDVDAASAATCLQDAVQYAIPIIKALALAELQIVVLRAAPGGGENEEQAAVGPASFAPLSETVTLNDGDGAAPQSSSESSAAPAPSLI